MARYTHYININKQALMLAIEYFRKVREEEFLEEYNTLIGCVTSKTIGFFRKRNPTAEEAKAAWKSLPIWMTENEKKRFGLSPKQKFLNSYKRRDEVSFRLEKLAIATHGPVVRVREEDFEVLAWYFQKSDVP